MEQLSIWDLLVTNTQTAVVEEKKGVLSVGDKIGRVVLGECHIATITKVEGLPSFPFYRTDRTCYSYEEGLESIESLLRKAEENRTKYETIEPHDLEERLTVVYPPRECDGKVLWAQLGIYEGMLFWKECVTYQFLERCKNEKDLRKRYKEHKQKILSDCDGTAIIVSDEHPMHRLYASKCAGGYADAEYAERNR